MAISEILARYDLSKSHIREHGFTDNMKDYRLLVELESGSETPGRYEFLFLGAIQVRYDMLEPENESDSFSTLGAWNGSSGAVSGGAADDYPQWSYVDDSPIAAEWSMRRNVVMNEIRVESPGRYLSVVFHDLEIRQV